MLMKREEEDERRGGMNLVKKLGEKQERGEMWWRKHGGDVNSEGGRE